MPARSNLKAPDERSVLNEDRPQNPFIPTDEPDWKVGKTTPGGSHALTHDKVKDQNSHRHSPTSDESQALQLDTYRNTLKPEVVLQGPNSRSSSQSSVVLMSSSTTRKAAPPIPKKPALLSNRQHSQESGKKEQGNSVSSRPPSGDPNKFGDGVKGTSSPPPLQIQQPKVYRRQAAKSDGPLLPPRSTGARVSIPNALMDDDNEGASTIPSLQPMRRQQ